MAKWLGSLVVLAWLWGVAQDAQAGVTIDVVFQDAPSPSGITIDPAIPSGVGSRQGPGCTFGGYYGGMVSTGYCMDVIMTTTWEFTEVSVSVAYDSDNGLAVDRIDEWRGIALVFDEKYPVSPPCKPTGGVVDYGGIIQRFDCTAPYPETQGPAWAGTYRIGTIIWDTSATTPGTEAIWAVLAAGDGVTAVINGNTVDVSSSVVLGSHILTIIPEPGTAALLGLGVVGVTLAARRRRG